MILKDCFNEMSNAVAITNNPNLQKITIQHSFEKAYSLTISDCENVEIIKFEKVGLRITNECVIKSKILFMRLITRSSKVTFTFF